MTKFSFTVLTLGEDEYSSIALIVGTSLGRIGSFKILPTEGGKGYMVNFVDSTSSSLEDPVVDIIPINTETGALAPASQHAVLGLRSGAKVSGAVIAITRSEARIYRPPSGKGVHKAWNEHSLACVAAGLIELEAYGVALVCAMLSGVVKVYSIPALKEVTELNIVGHRGVDVTKTEEVHIFPNGDIVALSSPTCLITLNMFGTGKGQPIKTTAASATGISSKNPIHVPADELYNPLTPCSPRPTISTLTWLSGTQYLSITDLDLLIGGPDRPAPKSQIEAERAELEEQRQEARAQRQLGATSSSGGSGAPQGGVASGGIWAGLQQSFNERTKHLNMMGDSMDKLGDTTKGFSDEVARLVGQQKKKALWGGIKSKFL